MSNWLYLIGSFCFVAGTLLNMVDFNHGALKDAPTTRALGTSASGSTPTSTRRCSAPAMRFEPSSIRCWTNKSSTNATGSPTQGTTP